MSKDLNKYIIEQVYCDTQHVTFSDLIKMAVYLYDGDGNIVDDRRYAVKEVLKVAFDSIMTSKSEGYDDLNQFGEADHHEVSTSNALNKNGTEYRYIELRSHRFSELSQNLHDLIISGPKTFEFDLMSSSDAVDVSGDFIKDVIDAGYSDIMMNFRGFTKYITVPMITRNMYGTKLKISNANIVITNKFELTNLIDAIFTDCSFKSLTRNFKTHLSITAKQTIEFSNITFEDPIIVKTGFQAVTDREEFKNTVCKFNNVEFNIGDNEYDLSNSAEYYLKASPLAEITNGYNFIGSSITINGGRYYKGIVFNNVTNVNIVDITRTSNEDRVVENIEAPTVVNNGCTVFNISGLTVHNTSEASSAVIGLVPENTSLVLTNITVSNIDIENATLLDLRSCKANKVVVSVGKVFGKRLVVTDPDTNIVRMNFYGLKVDVDEFSINACNANFAECTITEKDNSKSNTDFGIITNIGTILSDTNIICPTRNLIFDVPNDASFSYKTGDIYAKSVKIYASADAEMSVGSEKSKQFVKLNALEIKSAGQVSISGIYSVVMGNINIVEMSKFELANLDKADIDNIAFEMNSLNAPVVFKNCKLSAVGSGFTLIDPPEAHTLTYERCSGKVNYALQCSHDIRRYDVKFDTCEELVSYMKSNVATTFKLKSENSKASAMYTKSAGCSAMIDLDSLDLRSCSRSIDESDLQTSDNKVLYGELNT